MKTAVLERGQRHVQGRQLHRHLANGGVTLAPYHDFASKVPAALQSELAKIKPEIISGKIKPATKSPV